MRISNNKAAPAMLAGLILAAGCALAPQHHRLLQGGLFAGLALAWGGGLSLLGNRRQPRKFLLALPLLALVPFLLPGKPLDTASLRADYVARLRGFDGTRYVWGGESSLGIDCSGLPRRALRDALWCAGWRHANGTAFRMWLAQWWFDTSARAMRDGYRGQTRPLGLAGPLWAMDPSRLQAGDLAVRGDGGHVVVYLGELEWIEADPTCGKVHRWVSQAGDGEWYAHMTVHRWMAIDEW